MKPRSSVITAMVLSLLSGACATTEPADATEGDQPVCGNAVVESGETCDDGGTVGGDGCSAQCLAEEVCTDSQDNDRDRLVDCADPDCTGHASCPLGEEVCDDPTGLDEDRDGAGNCRDPDCASHPSCVPAEEICDDVGLADEDGDGSANCDDPDCAADAACAPPAAETCDDVAQLDEDDDGLANCADPDCSEALACQPPEEVCDDESGADEDGDGLAGCDDPDCATHAVCLCGNAEHEAGEACDDGVLNNDRAPNACRTDCSFPTCGDGVIDDDNPDPSAAVPVEQCDGGGNCTANCQIDDLAGACGEGISILALTPDDRLGEDPDHYLVRGELRGGPGHFTPGVECGESLPPTSAEDIYVFWPSAAGTFLARTDFFGTLVDTVVYARSNNCTSGPSICNDDTDTDFGSHIVFEGNPGTPVFLFVDSFAGDWGEYDLEVAPVTVVGDGLTCAPPYTTCDDGLACIERESGRSCGAPTAPTVTETSAVVVDNGGTFSLLVRVRGVDPDEDVASFVGWLEDTAAPNPIDDLDLDFDFVTVSVGAAGSYEATARLGFGTTSPIAAGYDTLNGTVVDSVGGASATLSAPLVARTVVGSNVACDGFAITCSTGFSCLPGGADRTCQAGVVAPTLDGLDLRWVAPNAVLLVATGTDTEADAWGLRIDWLDDGGLVIDDADLGLVPLDLPFNNNVVGANPWEGRAALFFNDPVVVAETVGAVRVRALDQSANQSASFIESPVPWPSVSAVGESCDGTGEETLCASDALCDDFFGPTGTCRALELRTHFCGFSADGDALVIVFESPADAADAIDDSVQFVLFDIYAGQELVANGGGWGYCDDPRAAEDGGFCVNGPSNGYFLGEGGLFQFTLTGINAISEMAGSTHVYCHVTTYAGQTSDFQRAERVDVALLGEVCDPAYSDLCFDELACLDPGAGPVCAFGTPPHIDDVHLSRFNQTNIALTIDVTDPDADLTGSYRLGWLAPDGTHWIVPPFVAPEPLAESVVGQTELNGLVINPSLPAGLEGEWVNIELLRVEVVDVAGLADAVDININRAEGEACLDPGTNPTTYVPCQTGLVCDSAGTGTCQPAP